MLKRRTAGTMILATALLVGPASLAQQPPGHEQGLPDPIPPPRPPKKPPKHAGNYQPIVPDSDLEWGLPEELRGPLFDKADVYRAFTKRFTCDEVARLAEYDDGGGVSDEDVRRYGYLLISDAATNAIQEIRQEMTADGSLKSGRVEDEEPFPPAYNWVFLFSRVFEPYFGYRYLGERFDGFDWVHEIQFKGSLPFTDGKDIRQWEGKILVDAVTYTPIEIVAEPSGQRDRIESLYRRWAKSFNFLGMRTGPRPYGYSARIQFRLRREGLTFPTELRYDTFRAVGIDQIVPARASTRTYRNYRIYEAPATPQIGDPTSP